MEDSELDSVQRRVNQWLKNLPGGEGNLQLDMTGNCYLVTEQGINLVVSCGKGKRQLILLSELLNVPIPLSARQYEEVLAINLNVEFTSGAQIYFDKRARALGLLFSRDFDTIDAISFGNIIGNFIHIGTEMKELLDAMVFGDSGSLGFQVFPHQLTQSGDAHSWRSA